MTHTPTGAEAIDLGQYWATATPIDEVLSQFIGTTSDEVQTQLEAPLVDIEIYAEKVRQGETTGTPLLDRIVAAGQVVSPARFLALKDIEKELEVGEPILVRQPSKWSLGVIADRDVQFGKVTPHQLAMNNRGRELVEVDGRTELLFSPFLGLVSRDYRGSGVDKMAVIEYERRLIGGSMYRTYVSLSPEHEGRVIEPTTTMPNELLEAWYRYADDARKPIGERLVKWDVLHSVGQNAVEADLGIGLDELLIHADNKALQAYNSEQTKN